jgi:UDPglucose 6-dehydrogenase
MLEISMIGTGYVGLVSGACLADFGHAVHCIDIDEKRIEALNRGEIPIYEPGLTELVRKNVEAGRLSFSTDLRPAVAASNVVFVAVGTPPREDGSTDLSHVHAAIKDVAAAVPRGEYRVVVQKSTVPVGTARAVGDLFREHASADATFDLVSNPEFLREGSAIEDFMRPNRVVIGVESRKAREIMEEIYRPLYLLETPMVITNLETAELIKYASNAYLAVKISFINEMADLCERVGAEIDVLARAMGLDRRIGPKFLHAGAGFGGSCLPKDTSSILHTGRERSLDLRIIRSAVEVNEDRIERVIGKLEDHLGDLKGRTVAVLGLSFKPNTDDVREAPALKVIRRILEKGGKVKGFDPVAGATARAELGSAIELARDAREATQGAHALVLMTEWNEFRQLDLEGMREAMAEPVIVDCRNVYSPARMRALGFRYTSFGRSAASDGGR